MPPGEARAARERLGLAAILSLDHAADLLPMDQGAARTWIEQQGLVRDVAGRRVVRWGDVYEALGGGRPPEPQPRAISAGLVRKSL